VNVDRGPMPSPGSCAWCPCQGSMGSGVGAAGQRLELFGGSGRLSALWQRSLGSWEFADFSSVSDMLLCVCVCVCPGV
jgi:hypothetical protein